MNIDGYKNEIPFENGPFWRDELVHFPGIFRVIFPSRPRFHQLSNEKTPGI